MIRANQARKGERDMMKATVKPMTFNPDDCPLCDGIGEISTIDRKTVECPHCIVRDVADRAREALKESSNG